MINKEQALNLARSFAREKSYGWDDRSYEIEIDLLANKQVWSILTLYIKTFTELPWLMEEMPNPIQYFIKISSGKCIAIK